MSLPRPLTWGASIGDSHIPASPVLNP